MEQNKHKLFAQLLESIVLESSSGVNLVKYNPGGAELLRQVHKTTPLPHDADWEIVKKISWSDIKGKGWRGTGGGWIILIGQKGTGAIHANKSGDYLIYASNGKKGVDDEEINRISGKYVSSGGDAISRIKEITGPIRSYAVTKMKGGDNDIEQKRKARAELKKSAAPDAVSSISSPADAQAMTERLLRRFKPVWVKALVQAIADIKGFTNLQIKNDAYHKVDKKLARLKTLVNWLRNLEDDGDAAQTGLKDVLLHAIDLAARHHFPDQVPNHFDRGGFVYGRELPEGYRLLLQGIASGDTKLLSTVLYFFKRGLLSS